jgi:thiol-disulfide isomerase/thioredoxin
MNKRRTLLQAVAICLCAVGTVSGRANQLPDYPAAKPGDPGYIAEDPQLARLVGMPAPSITLKSIDDRAIDIVNSYGRKPVYLKLWATYCIPCRAQMPGFERIYQAYRDRMQIVAVDAGVGDDPENVRAFVAKAKMHMPVAIDDGSLGAWLKLEATPFHVLIGLDGRIAYAGHQDGPPLDAAIQRVLAGGANRGRIETATVGSVTPLRPGDVVPAIDLRRSNDTPVQLASGATGRPRAIVFTAVWCESYLKDTEPDTVEACRHTREQVDTLSQTGAIDWLGVVAHLWTTPKSLGAYEARQKPRVPMAVDSDGQAFRSFGIRRLPAVALIGADGRLRRIVGPDETDLAAAVEDLLMHPLPTRRPPP